MRSSNLLLSAALFGTMAAPAQKTVASRPAAQPSQPSIGIAAEYAYETSDFLAKYEYASPETMFATARDDGAYGANVPFDQGRSKRWFIEEQRWGRDLILAGIARSQPAAIDRGLRMLQWGFAHQSADGSFACPDAFHSTSFFVDAVGQAIIMLRASPYAANYAAAVDPMIPHLHTAALWMTHPDVIANAFQGPMSEAPYTHRRFLVAAGLGEAALLTHDATLAAAAAASARAGIDMQAPSGYNPEKGGYDSSYHAVGVVFAQRYYTLAAPADLRPALYASVGRAVDWAASRLTSDGKNDSHRQHPRQWRTGNRPHRHAQAAELSWHLSTALPLGTNVRSSQLRCRGRAGCCRYTRFDHARISSRKVDPHFARLRPQSRRRDRHVADSWAGFPTESR